ncbi:ATP-binding protein [Sorangium sp. So ce296]|uniref:ATP-binding protein n=1 Tax=Sorangium sp. So ce296 TaxID=3133296 RepID=UPI003F6101B4
MDGAGAGAGSAWIDANQRYVSAAVRLVQARLTDAARRIDDKAPPDGAGDEAARQLRELAQAMPVPAALERIRRAFDLSPFEYEVLLLVAAVELAGAVGQACGALHGDPRRRHASFGLALWVLPNADWSALSPEAALRRWQLVTLQEGGITDAALHIDERILHEIAGVTSLDERLRGVVTIPEGARVPARYRDAVEEIARCLEAPSAPVVVLSGGSAASRAAVACAALRARRAAPLVARVGDVPAQPAERELFVALVRRELMLRGGGLLIEAAPGSSAERIAAARSLAQGSDHPVVVSVGGELGLEGPTVSVALPALDAAGQRAIWVEALGGAAVAEDVLDDLVSEFRPEPEEIARVADEWRCRVEAGETADAAEEHPLRRRLRAANRGRYEGLAHVSVPVARREDLVLPEAQSEILRQLELHVRYRRTVLEDWGFLRREARGLGVTALFHGPSGTGKTLAAEVIAGRLGLDLVRVDLSQVVSKYIGETEKNLRSIFDAADRGGAVLLFDEADAIFGKRTEVKDSHDRYANIEVGYLLQRMEAFRGLAILTTNAKQSLDTAFLRRLRFVVAFPFPGAAERREMWRRALPAAAPREGLDVDRLARLEATGASIRNIALHAAFLAAAERAPVRMAHLFMAARDECARIEKSVSAAEIGGWV